MNVILLHSNHRYVSTNLKMAQDVSKHVGGY